MSFVLASLGFAQMEIKLIVKGSISDTSKSILSGTSIYLLQENVTVASSLSEKNGSFVLVGSVYNKAPLTVQFSKQGFLTRNVLYDISGLEIPKKVVSITVMLAENLKVQMFPVKPIFNFTVGTNDYAEKFKWDEKQAECIPDVAYKTKYNDSLRTRVWQEEGKLKLEKFKTKSKELEQVQNYKLALDYLDTAISTQTGHNLVDTSLSRKKTMLQKAFSAQQLAQQKQKSIDSLFHKGDSLLALLKWQDAEKVYNQVKTLDPKSEKLQIKLKSIDAIKKEEDDRKNEIIACKKNRDDCTSLASNKKYSEAITAITKNKTLTRIPQALKNAVAVTVDSLNLLIKEQNLDKEVMTAMEASKKVKSDNPTMKNALEKVSALISNYESKAKQASTFADLDKVIKDYVEAEIQKGYDLQSKQEYDKAIQVYDQTKDILAFTHDAANKQTKVNDIDQKVEAAKRAKEQDLQNFNLALTKVKNALDSLTFDTKYGANYQPTVAFGIIKTLLANSPLKQKLTTPEVSVLKTRMTKLESYFNPNAKLLKNIAVKDSTKALQAANEFLTKAGVAEVGKLEITFLKNKIDSLQAKMKIAPAASGSNTVRGIVLSPPPGAKLYTGNPSVLQTSLSSSSDRQAQRIRNVWDKLKASVDDANYRASVQHEEAVRANRNFVETLEAVRSQISQEEAELAKKREISNRDLVNETQAKIAEQNLANQVLTERLADIQDRQRNLHDSIMAHQSDNHNLAREATQHFVDSMNVVKTQKDIEAELQNKSLDEAQRKTVNDNQTATYLANQAALEQTKRAQRAQEERMNYVKVENYTPNYLKNDSGQCFPWNAMTELVYTYEDAFGFEIGKVVRRVVVNAQGYGVVYEQTVNESGVSSFTLNGQAITETIWLHDSYGSPFLSEGGPINPPTCP
jgi:tetratricopeptide (TPR) repeat protein